MRVWMILSVLLLPAVLMMPGCGPSEADATQAQVPRELSFVVINQSGGKIDSIGLEGANFPMAFGPIEKGESRTLKNNKLELPEKLTLHWTDARGNRKEGSVNVWNELSASYSGPVKLTVNQRGKVNLAGG